MNGLVLHLRILEPAKHHQRRNHNHQQKNEANYDSAIFRLREMRRKETPVCTPSMEEPPRRTWRLVGSREETGHNHQVAEPLRTISR
jgi:hypothetical protein